MLLQSVNFLERQKMFFSSFASPRWTPSTGPRDTLQTHMFLCEFCKAEGLRYQKS